MKSSIFFAIVISLVGGVLLIELFLQKVLG